MKTLEEYKTEIENAKTTCELHKISFECLKQENSGSAIIGKRSLYNAVVSLCAKRQMTLTN